MRPKKRFVQCFYCRHPFTPREITRDHFIPRALGGQDAGNIVDACKPCNQRKADRLPTEKEIERFVKEFGAPPPYFQHGNRFYKRFQPTTEGAWNPVRAMRVELNIHNRMNGAIYAVVQRAHQRLDDLKLELGL
jgi:hypothetical protein